MTAVATESVQTGLRPASSRPGFCTARPVSHGPSPPETVSMPSMIVRSIGRMPSAVDRVPRDPVGRPPRRGGVELLGQAVGRPLLPAVEDRHAGRGALLVRLVVRVEGRGRDAEVVLDAQGHPGRRVVLQLGQRDVDVAIDVGMVQVIGREEAAAPWAPSPRGTASPCPGCACPRTRRPPSGPRARSGPSRRRLR